MSQAAKDGDLVVDIALTRALAAAIIERNEDDERAINEWLVDALRKPLGGQYGEPIVLTTDGKIVDGLHRIVAAAQYSDDERPFKARLEISTNAAARRRPTAYEYLQGIRKARD